jgi:hypothetical protein
MSDEKRSLEFQSTELTGNLRGIPLEEVTPPLATASSSISSSPPPRQVSTVIILGLIKTSTPDHFRRWHHWNVIFKDARQAPEYDTLQQHSVQIVLAAARD